MTDNRQQPRPPQPIKVAIETEEPKKIGDSWSILATAIVSQGNRTLDGREVQFFVDGIIYDQPVQADSNGRAQIDIVGIDQNAQRVSIEAQIVGQSSRARKVISLPETKKGVKPNDLEIRTEGKNGDYQIHMQIVGSECQGVKGTIRIICRNGKEDMVSKDNGSCFKKMRLAESQEIHFCVLGTAVDKKLFLLGPKKPHHPCPPTPKSVTGFFNGLEAGWKKRKRQEKKRSQS